MIAVNVVPRFQTPQEFAKNYQSGVFESTIIRLIIETGLIGSIWFCINGFGAMGLQGILPQKCHGRVCGHPGLPEIPTDYM